MLGKPSCSSRGAYPPRRALAARGCRRGWPSSVASPASSSTSIAMVVPSHFQVELSAPVIGCPTQGGFEYVAFGSGRGRAASPRRAAAGRNVPKPRHLATWPTRTERIKPQVKSHSPADTLADASKQALGRRAGTWDLTVRDVAGRLQVSTATVYGLCRRREIEYHRVSHAIRIPESAVAKYLASAGRDIFDALVRGRTEAARGRSRAVRDRRSTGRERDHSAHGWRRYRWGRARTRAAPGSWSPSVTRGRS
jgi:excisionase family DNA binding protein